MVETANSRNQETGPYKTVRCRKGLQEACRLIPKEVLAALLINRIIVQVAPGTNVCNLLTRYLRRTCLGRTPRTLGMGQGVAFESFSRKEVS